MNRIIFIFIILMGQSLAYGQRLHGIAFEVADTLPVWVHIYLKSPVAYEKSEQEILFNDLQTLEVRFYFAGCVEYPDAYLHDTLIAIYPTLPELSINIVTIRDTFSGCDLPLEPYITEQKQINGILVPYILDFQTVKPMDLQIYPNPATDFVQVKNANFSMGNYCIRSVTGNIVQQQDYYGQTISIADLPIGHYILYLNTSIGTFAQQFIKINSK